MSSTGSRPKYTDGFYGTPRLIYTTPKEYPFKQTGDLTTAVYTSTFRVDPASWIPTALGTVDPLHAGFYLVDETQPDDKNEAASALFTRTYANVPLQQTAPASLQFTRPSPPGSTFPQAFGQYRIFQPDSTLASYDAYIPKTVTSDSGAPSANGYPTGGTYTLSFGGATTSALAYNADAATVQAALNALTPITNRGGVTVTGSYNSAGGFAITLASYGTISLDAGSLTGTGSPTPKQTLNNNGYTQTVGAVQGASAVTFSSSLVWSPSSPTVTIETNLSGGQYYDNVRVYGQYTTGGASTADATIVGGTFTLTVLGATTGAIAYNASFSDIAAALNALGVGTFSVTAYRGVSDTQPLIASGTSLEFQINWVQVPVTGGTFTISTPGGSTSALAYNADAATVQAALNAISWVSTRGGCTVSGTLAGSYSINFSNAALGSASSLTPGTSAITAITTDSGVGRTQQVTFAAGSATTRSLYCAANGFTLTDYLYVKIGSNYYTFGPGTFALPDANTIQPFSSAGGAYTDGSVCTEIGKRTKTGYAPGTMSIRAKSVTKFYLPGVTPGITTADDIPIPVNQSDAASLLTAILVGTGTINYAVGNLKFWRGSILSLEVTTINAADV